MDPTIIIGGIRALVRLAREGQAAFNQYERDKPALFPAGLSADFSDITFIRTAFIPKHVDLLQGNGAFARYWRGTDVAADVPGAQEALYIGAVQLFTQDRAQSTTLGPTRSLEVGGAVMLQQWVEGKGPVGPIGRMVLCIADVALEFVGANPSVLGIGGNAEKLIAAFAKNLSDMIPDDADALGSKSQLAERFVGIFLRAALTALNEHPDGILREDHLRLLVKNTLPPIIAALPGDLGTDLVAQDRWRAVADAVLGPAASAAIATIAENPATFFGATLDPHNAIGALTQALLKQASTTGLRQQFSEAGFIALYKAALGVVAERPELFLGRPGTPTEKLAENLFGNIATALRNSPPPFNADVGAQLAVAALDALRQNGAGFFDSKRPWESMAGSIAVQVVNGLRGALADPTTGSIRSLLSERQLLELARIFVAQVAKTPGMISGGSTELQAIVGAVASAMAADQHLLLAPEDWLAIAAVAAEEAAANPQRLFKIDGTTPADATGTELIKDLLSVASATFVQGRAAGGVLFGTTLRDAVTLVLRAAAGNVRAATDNRAAVRDLAKTLADLVQAHADQFGSKEWLFLYRSLLPRVLQGSAVVALTPQQANQLLAGGVVT